MAKAGDLYDTITGNIWSYAHRGDLTGVKAALARGVCVDMANTVGWTACHAAAAGGQAKVLRLLLRAGADISIRDNGGNLAMHEAAKGGHAPCLQVLADAGARLETIRLSQTKGAAVRALVTEAARKAEAKGSAASGPDPEGPEAVGYARVQAKSNAFFGPRKTPISGKIRRNILKEKRRKKALAEEDADAEDGSGRETAEGGDGAAEGLEGDRVEEGPEAAAVWPEVGYAETVKAVKAKVRQARRQCRAKAEEREVADGDGVTLETVGAALEEAMGGRGEADVRRTNVFLALGADSDDDDREESDRECDGETSVSS